MRLPPRLRPGVLRCPNALHHARDEVRTPPRPRPLLCLPFGLPSAHYLHTSATTPFAKTTAARVPQVWDADGKPMAAATTKHKFKGAPRARRSPGSTPAQGASTPRRRALQPSETGGGSVHSVAYEYNAGRSSGGKKQSRGIGPTPLAATPRRKASQVWDGDDNAATTASQSSPASHMPRTSLRLSTAGSRPRREKRSTDAEDSRNLLDNVSPTRTAAPGTRPPPLATSHKAVRNLRGKFRQEPRGQPPDKTHPPPNSKIDYRPEDMLVSQHEPHFASTAKRMPRPEANSCHDAPMTSACTLTSRAKPKRVSAPLLRTDIESLAGQRDRINSFVLDIFGDAAVAPDEASMEAQLPAQVSSAPRSELDQLRQRELDEAMAVVDLEGRIVDLAVPKGQKPKAKPSVSIQLWGKELAQSTHKVLEQLNNPVVSADPEARASLKAQIIALLPLAERTHKTKPKGYTIPITTDNLVLEAFVRQRRKATSLPGLPYLVQYGEDVGSDPGKRRAEAQDSGFDQPEGISYFLQLFHTMLEHDVIMGKHSLTLLIEGLALYPDADAGEERALGELISTKPVSIPLFNGGHGRAANGRLCGVAQAYSLLHGAIARDQAPTSSVMYNTLIQAAVKTGEFGIVLAVLGIMRDTAIELTLDTCLSILPAVPVEALETIPTYPPTHAARTKIEADLNIRWKMVEQAYTHILSLASVPREIRIEQARKYMLFSLAKGDVIRAGQVIRVQLHTISPSLASAFPAAGINCSVDGQDQRLLRDFVWGLMCRHEFVHAFDWLEALVRSPARGSQDEPRWVARVIQSMLTFFRDHPGQAEPWLVQRVEGLVCPLVRAERAMGEDLASAVFKTRTRELDRLVGASVEALMLTLCPPKALELPVVSFVQTQLAREHVYATWRLAQDLSAQGCLPQAVLPQLAPLVALLNWFGDLEGAIDLWAFIAKTCLQAHNGAPDEKLVTKLRSLEAHLRQATDSPAAVPVVDAHRALTLQATAQLLALPSCRVRHGS